MDTKATIMARRALASDAASDTHAPAQTYSFRVPSPPRIIVPPPALNENGIPDLHVALDHNIDYNSSGFSNTDFLTTVTYGNFITQNNMLEWKYEQRRTAQKILPFLFLGPVSAAKDKGFLQEEGITMLLAVRNTMSAQARLLGSRAAQDLGLEIKNIDVAGNQELIAAYPQGVEAINAHLSDMYRLQESRRHSSNTNRDELASSTPGTVLVFCESGNERSATMVAAYIMAMYSKDLSTAIQIVQAQRFCVAFDDSLRNLLSTYESILQAKRDVHQANNGSTGWLREGEGARNHTNGSSMTTKSCKRTLDDSHDGDVDMDMEGGHGEMDAARFERREGLAPFQDRMST